MVYGLTSISSQKRSILMSYVFSLVSCLRVRLVNVIRCGDVLCALLVVQYFCSICLGSFICPPVFLPLLYQFTSGHRLFLLGLTHVVLIAWPLVLLNLYSLIHTEDVTLAADGITLISTPVEWTVRISDRVFPILAYALLMFVYATKYSFLEKNETSKGVNPTPAAAVTPTNIPAPTTATGSSSQSTELVFKFIEQHVMPPSHQNPIYAFDANRELFTIKRSFIVRWALLSRLCAIPHLLFSPLYRYWVLSANLSAAGVTTAASLGDTACTVAGTGTGTGGGVGVGVGAAAAASAVSIENFGWFAETWSGTAHVIYCCIATFAVISQLMFLILETFEFFLLRLRCIERFNTISETPISSIPVTPVTPPPVPVPAPPPPLVPSSSDSKTPPPSATPTSPPSPVGVVPKHFDFRSMHGLRFWFAVRARTFHLFQIRFSGLQAVTGLLLLTGTSLLLYLVLQRSRAGSKFLFDDIATRALLDILCILFFVFLLVQVSSRISDARKAQGRILTAKRCELSFDTESVSPSDNTKLQAAIQTIIAHVKETNEPPTVLGLKINSGLSDKIVGLAILALVNVFSDVLSFFHVPSAKEIAAAAIPLSSGK